MKSNQAVINEVNGNVMAWLAQRQIDDEYKEELRTLKESIKCVICGAKEKVKWVPTHKNGAFAYKYKSSLTDNVCDDCLMKEAEDECAKERP